MLKKLPDLRYTNEGTAIEELSSLVVSSAKALQAAVEVTDKDAVLSVEKAILLNLRDRLSKEGK